MLRKNAWATELARLAIVDVTACGEDMVGVEVALEDLMDALVAMLPSEAAKVELCAEKQGAPGIATDWIDTNGVGNWLAFLTSGLMYPSAWWGTPGFPEIVEVYCALDPGPPEPDTFRDRMLRVPWQLSDEQAKFVCRHRYDVG